MDVIVSIFFEKKNVNKKRRGKKYISSFRDSKKMRLVF